MRRIDRPRLVNLLRPRHQLLLTVLEAPPGFGISTVLEQAVTAQASNPGVRDIRIAGHRSLAAPGALADAILAALGAPGSDTGGDAVLAVLAGRPETVAILIDDFELTAPGGTELCARLLSSGQSKVHLVLAGRSMPGIGLSRWVAAGAAVHIRAGELAFRPDEIEAVFRAVDRPAPVDGNVASWPALASLLVADRADLLASYLRDRALPALDPDVAATLSAIAVAGGSPTESIGPVLAAASGGRPDSVDVARLLAVLASVPLVEVDGQGCWPHPLWREAAAGGVDPVVRSRVLVARLEADQSATTVQEVAAAAIRWRDGPVLTRAVRRALAATPVLAGVNDLRAWADSGLIDGPEADWLAGVVSVRSGGATSHAMDRLEAARTRFQAAGEADAETAVLLQLGIAARSRDDLATLSRLLDRASELAQDGQPAAFALVALGRAVRAQLAGDPAAALQALQEVPVGALAGDWATQVLMICGTNLALAGRTAEAVAVLEVADGTGSAPVRAVASDLLSAARWSSGDRVAAIEAARAGLRLAEDGDSPGGTTMARAALACRVPCAGRLGEAETLLDRVAGTVPSGEAAALAGIGRVLVAVTRRDLEGARRLLESLGPPVSRPTRSSLWRAALETGLSAGTAAAWGDVADRSPAFASAVAAGREWAAAMAAGRLLSGNWRPYIPDVWCQVTDNPIRIRLLGRGDVELWSGDAPSRAWTRPRVRELCLHLALCDDVSRETVAARLWPDLDQKAAGTNLRVTLSHLLDVLEPGRPRGAGSGLVRHEHGQLTFDRRQALRIDVWDVSDSAHTVIAAGRDEVPAIVAAARRMVEAGSGRFLGGGHCGDWVDSYRRRFEDDVIHAVRRAGPMALDKGDFDLAEELAERVLELDPWSEDGHRLLLSARLAGGDPDGARRALAEADVRFGEIGVRPSEQFRSVARRIHYRARPS